MRRQGRRASVMQRAAGGEPSCRCILHGCSRCSDLFCGRFGQPEVEFIFVCGGHDAARLYARMDAIRVDLPRHQSSSPWQHLHIPQKLEATRPGSLAGWGETATLQVLNRAPRWCRVAGPVRDSLRTQSAHSAQTCTSCTTPTPTASASTPSRCAARTPKKSAPLFHSQRLAARAALTHCLRCTHRVWSRRRRRTASRPSRPTPRASRPTTNSQSTGSSASAASASSRCSSRRRHCD